MSAFLKKLILKWSAITALGLSAYLLGFSWGAVGLNQKEKIQAKLESERAIQAQQEIKDLHQLGQWHEMENPIFLPTSQQPTNLSQLK